MSNRPHKKKKPQPPAKGEQPPPAVEPQAPDAQQLQAERDDLLARLKRVSADYLNFQKRQGRAIAEARDYAVADLIKELLAVLDDMERAMAAAEANHDAADPLLAGMRLVYNKALEVLAKSGLRQIDAVGEPFDPERHEAMMQEPSDAHHEPTVLRQLQRGYELKSRVLRPARVVVSAPPPAEQDQQPHTEGD